MQGEGRHTGSYDPATTVVFSIAMIAMMIRDTMTSIYLHDLSILRPFLIWGSEEKRVRETVRTNSKKRKRASYFRKCEAKCENFSLLLKILGVRITILTPNLALSKCEGSEDFTYCNPIVSLIYIIINMAGSVTDLPLDDASQLYDVINDIINEDDAKEAKYTEGRGVLLTTHFIPNPRFY